MRPLPPHDRAVQTPNIYAVVAEHNWNIYTSFSLCSDSAHRGTPMLTRKQHELLMFIHERMKEAGIPPSFDEMKDALDLRSKSGIHRLITALEERGFIRRLPNRARALEVVRLPDSMNPSLGGKKTRFEPNVIEGTLGRVAQMPQRANAGGDAARPVSV